MTRFTCLLAAIAVSVVTLTPVTAQQPDNSFRAQVARMPASAFRKSTGGVRGMALTVSRKMDPRLRTLVDTSRGGGDVRSRSLELGANGATLRVPVTAYAADPSRVASLVADMRALGGEVSATFDTTVWGLLAPPAVDRLAQSENLHYMTVQEKFEPTQAASGTAEDSLRATRVQELLKQGVRGRGVKVGIIDFGYQQYRRLQQAGVVPEPKAIKTFGALQSFEGPVEHGTACAEIIHAMAPDAELYLATVDGNGGSTVEAGKWLVAQGVDIISFSGGGTGGPSDGQGPMDRYVDETTEQKNVLWVIAAGNAGDKHWLGPNQDKDNNGVIEDGLVEFVATGDEIRVNVRWNDWGSDLRTPGSTQDINAFLLMEGPNGGKPIEVAKGDDAQNGVGAPTETIAFKQKGITGKHFLVVLVNEKTSRPLDVHVFVDHGIVIDGRPQGSVSSPASASSAVAVGAWDVSKNAVANYSSWGPTDDNRQKPEIGAPAGLRSAAYNGVFHGTSAATPHVSGFAALIKSANPGLSGTALRGVLLKAVEPNGTPVPNMATGYGLIDGRRIPGLVTVPPPAVATPPSPVSGGVPAPAPGPVAPAPPAPGRPPATAAAGRRIALPVAWGGSVSSEFLERVRMPADEPREFLTRLTTGRDLYRFGDGLKVGFKSSEKCDYLLFHRSSRGEYTLLSPRDGVVAALAPGAPLLLPSDTETFEVTPPAGTEELVLLCARKALDLSGAASAPRPPAGLVVARHLYQIAQ